MGKFTRTGSLALAAAIAATLAVAPSASAAWTDGTDVPGGFNTTARIAGADRYETAVAASEELRATDKVGDTVIIGNAFNYSDVLAAAPLADLVDAPVLITAATSLNSSVAAELAALKTAGVSNVIILGGESAVSADVAAAIADIFDDTSDTIERIGGVDRYETAALIAEMIDYLDLAADDALRTNLDAARAQLVAYMEAQDALDAAIADLQAAAADLAPAAAAVADAWAEIGALQAERGEIVARLVEVPGFETSIYAATYDDWDEALTALTNAAVADQDALEAEVVARDLMLELQAVDADAPLADFIAGTVGDLTDDEIAEVSAAVELLGLDASVDTPTTAIAAAEADIPGLTEARDTSAAALGDLVDAIADEAAAVEANAPVLADLADIEAEIDAAVEALEDAVAAQTEVRADYDEALIDLQAAVDALEAFDAASVEVLEEAVLEARLAIIAASDNEVFLTTGVIFPDALSAGAAAGEEEGVVLLTRGTEFDSRGFTEAFLEANEADVYAIGGPSAAAVEADVEYVGADRFETATMVAEEFYADATVVGVAAGYHDRFPDDSQAPDAVVASAFMANNDGPLVLVKNDELPAYTADYLRFSAPDQVVIFGGPTAISPAVGDAIDDALDY